MSTVKHSQTSDAPLLARETLANPDWARMPRSRERLMGFSRSALYELANTGKITTKAICKPGCVKGMRLVYVPSLAAFIADAGL